LSALFVLIAGRPEFLHPDRDATSFIMKTRKTWRENLLSGGRLWRRLVVSFLAMAALAALAIVPRGVAQPAASAPAAAAAQAKDAPVEDPLLRLMGEELDYSIKRLVTEDGTRPYYLCYTITHTVSAGVVASLGAIEQDDLRERRILDVDARVGGYELDNTRQIRGGAGDRFARRFEGLAQAPLEDDPLAVRQVLWQATDSAFKAAVERFQRVKTDLKTTVEEDQKAHDFSRETSAHHVEAPLKLSPDRVAWAARARNVSRLALDYPLVHESSVTLVATVDNRSIATSEGSRIRTGQKLLRVALSASTKAEDGMDLGQSYIFDTATESGLPSEDAMKAEFRKVLDKVMALRSAPLVEPYTGPAILLNRASGVFFHEIFGHRIEGHRQKDVEEGQTFTKMVGKPILPDFLSVTDDPTRARHGTDDLRGFYRFDDEGVPASKVNLVENGVLKTFLLSRSPVAGFPKSNGHGRREPGRQVVSRQGNLIVQSTRTMPFAQLREMLIAECRRQNKPYGYLFEDITGGFTTTARGGPQAFKVLPVVVYRVYADGRKDELVRGVDIVGTPLSCFAKILATGDDPAVFNGTCGAESGWVPVSAISPSILVGEIEIEKRERAQERLPILPSPLAKKEAQ
jgi:predicted Zn-dependent protease